MSHLIQAACVTTIEAMLIYPFWARICAWMLPEVPNDER